MSGRPGPPTCLPFSRCATRLSAPTPRAPVPAFRGILTVAVGGHGAYRYRLTPGGRQVLANLSTQGAAEQATCRALVEEWKKKDLGARIRYVSANHADFARPSKYGTVWIITAPTCRGITNPGGTKPRMFHSRLHAPADAPGRSSASARPWASAGACRPTDSAPGGSAGCQLVPSAQGDFGRSWLVDSAADRGPPPAPASTIRSGPS